jgi:polyisoprenoid-binding protein YceI
MGIRPRINPRRNLVSTILVGPMIGLLLSGQPLVTASAADSSDLRWISLDEASLKDTQTGLEWTRSDNGHDIDWHQAKQFCDGHGKQWRLPTAQELISLYDARRTVGATCGKSHCRVSGLFNLTGDWFWSSDPVGKDGSDGNELAWGVLLVTGARTPSVQGLPDGSRALCVRAPTGAEKAPLLDHSATVALPIDQSHTAVIFSWSHRGLSHPIARLEQVKGTLVWNRTDLAKSSVEVNLPLDGLRTGDDALNRRLRGSEFFDAVRYPGINFRSTSIVPKVGSNEFTLVGNLTVHGVTKSVTLVAKINQVKEDSSQLPSMGFDADGVLRRSDFGLSRYVPMVGDEITIHITLEAHPG